MCNSWQTMWKFHTDRFSVSWQIMPDSDLDLSWDDTGETRDKLERGIYTAFQSRVVVLHRGREIGADYLGGSIYENPADFRDHIGLAIKRRADGRNYGSYFTDMVREAIKEARKTLKDSQKIYIRS